MARKFGSIVNSSSNLHSTKSDKIIQHISIFLYVTQQLPLVSKLKIDRCYQRIPQHFVFCTSFCRISCSFSTKFTREVRNDIQRGGDFYVNRSAILEQNHYRMTIKYYVGHEDV